MGRLHAQGQRGFSIVEMTVVVAILGLMVGVGFPAMQEWLDTYRCRGAASEIASAIQLQRMRAVSQNSEFSIAFDAANGTYTLYEGDPSTGTMLDAVPRSLPFGVAFSGNADAIDIPSDEIIFNPDGSMNDASASTDTVWVGNTVGDQFTVSFNRSTGRVEVAHQ